MAVHRAVLQTEALTVDKMEDRMVEVHRAVPPAEASKVVAKMAEVHRAVPQAEALMVVKTVCRVCPEIGADSPVGMAITSPAILPVIMAWECPQ